MSFLLCWLHKHKTNSILKILFSVYVPSSLKNEDETRVHDKKNTCFYCRKEFLKVGRHLQQVHKECAEVEKALSYPCHSKERKRELDRIRLLGNYVHNNKVLEQDKGELKVVHRPPAGVKGNPLSYLPCMYCYGFFHKGELYRHVHTCEFVNEHDKVHPRQLRYNGSLLLSTNKTSQVCSQSLAKHVLPRMKQDNVSLVARKDDVILIYGEALVNKHGQWCSQRSRPAGPKISIK